MTLPAIEWVDAAVCATLLQDNSSIHTHVHTYICTCNFRQTPTPHQLHGICIKKPNAGIYLSILFLRNKKKGEHKKKTFCHIASEEGEAKEKVLLDSDSMHTI